MRRPILNLYLHFSRKWHIIIVLVLLFGTNTAKGVVFMIIMRVMADNILCFNDFDINMAYPKKIVNSNIENECLRERTNFRFKKVNILMGTNATGKTSFGRILMQFMNYFSDGIVTRLTDMIGDFSKDASLTIDFVTTQLRLYRFTFKARAKNSNNSEGNNVSIIIKSVPINKTDSYETCVAKLEDDKKCEYTTYDKVDTIGWSFTFPRDITGNKPYSLIGKSPQYLTVLEKVLKTLDPAIRKVEGCRQFICDKA